MRKIGLCGVLATIALMAATNGAYAVVIINCSTSGAGALATEFNVNHPGGQANTTYAVTGPCNGDFNIAQNGITIQGTGANHTISGSIGIAAANSVTLQSLTINGDNFNSGAVTIAGSQGVTITQVAAQNGPLDGIAVFGPARVDISSTTIQNNSGNGLHAIAGAVITSSNNTITGNGGVGVLDELGSTVELAGGDSVSQGNAPNNAAVVAQGSSSLRLVNTTVTGPTNNHTVLVSQASSALIEGANITADTPFNANDVLAVVAAARGSTITLAGGNTVTNSAIGGAAVLVSEGSTFVEDNGTPEGFTAAADTVNGDGRVNTQCVIELGAAAGGGGVNWTGNLFASQFSSFRADGDNVTINGTLSLGQAGNAYFNNTKGTTINIAHVVCQSTTDHVQNPTLVTPNVMTGSTPPACALF